MEQSHLETEFEGERHPQTKKKRTSKMWVWRSLVVLLASTIAFCLFFYLYLRYAELPPSDIANASQLVASDQSVLTDLVAGGENRLNISLNEVPQVVIDSTIAVEDQQFYRHSGFNPVGIAKAFWKDIQAGSWHAGGSTITQQLAKNLYLTQEQTWSRKFRELMYALQLELNFTKDEILEQYLNVIYYGQGAYGIEMASQNYFNKPAKKLNLAEASLLAGLPQSPNYYNPLLNLPEAKKRQKTVLDLMVQEKFVTQAEADKAYNTKLQFAPQRTTHGQAPYFTDYVTWQLKHKYGISEGDIYRGGLKVNTTLDPLMQKAAEKAIENGLKDLPKSSNLQVSLISIDPNTGEIKAMVGGRNYLQSPYNRTMAKRQPGSAFKPFVYLAALNNNYTAATQVKSEKTTFEYQDDNGDEKSYTVHNFNDNYLNGLISFRNAIARSDNIFAVTTNMDIGPEKVVTTAKAMGIESEMKPYPSLALGTFPATPLEMVRAYAPLANGGFKVEPHAIKSIENAFDDKTVSYEEQKQALIDPGVAYILTDMMKSVFTDQAGTGHRVQHLFDRTVAGKTGTTDTDAWMIGYTPQLLTAVWVGYDKDTLLSPTESYLAAPIWAEFMKAAHLALPETDFAVPSNVVESYIDPATGQLATENCPVKQREYFLVGTEPTDWCEVHPSLTGTVKNVEQKTESGIRSFWNWVTGD